jgi:hypothetical protein
VSRQPFKIGIAGSHSTGKSTFVSKVDSVLSAKGLRVGRIDDLATRARDLGFPILTEHTYESTLWIMAECMRQEAEASLVSDVILVDRPVPDALGYLYAALEVSSRKICAQSLKELAAIAEAHVQGYDLLVVTVLDSSIPLGEGRDADVGFRMAAARHVSDLMDKIAPEATKMTAANADEVVSKAILTAVRRLGL